MTIIHELPFVDKSIRINNDAESSFGITDLSGENGATFDLTNALRPLTSVEGMDRRLLLSYAYAYATTNHYVHGKGYLSCTFERCLERSPYLASVPSWKGILHS